MLIDDWFLSLVPDHRLLVILLYSGCENQTGIFNPNYAMLSLQSGITQKSIKEFLENISTNSYPDYINFDSETNEVLLCAYWKYAYKETKNYKKRILEDMKTVHSYTLLKQVRGFPISRDYKMMISNRLRSLSNTPKSHIETGVPSELADTQDVRSVFPEVEGEGESRRGSVSVKKDDFKQTHTPLNNRKYTHGFSNDTEVYNSVVQKIKENPEWWDGIRTYCKVRSVKKEKLETVIKKWAAYNFIERPFDLVNFEKIEASIKGWLLREHFK